MTNNKLIDTFKKEKIWVNYRFKQLPDGKQTKIPYDANTNRMASTTDPETWADYENAIQASERIGIIFSPLKKLTGIDIDHCVNKETKEIEHPDKEVIENFIQEANTYCEISPSGTGIHLYIATTEPLILEANRKTPFEIYNSGRYFTVTQEPFTLNNTEYNKDIRELTTHEATKLLETIGYPWKQIVISDKSEIKISSPITFTDQELIQKMFNSKNGINIQACYNNVTLKGVSEDDMALCSHLAFWTGKNYDQMERIWLSSPLGQRAKTRDREDYRKRTIEKAIKSCNEVYDPTPVATKETLKAIEKEDDIDLLFTPTSNGGKSIVVNTENVYRIINKHSRFKGKIRFDKFKNVLEIDMMRAGSWKNIEESDVIEIQTQISVLFPSFLKITKGMVFDAIVKVSKDNQIDSAVDYIKALKWDGIPRLNQWLTNTYGCEDDVYHQAVGSNWIKGLIKRIIHPGCKFDYVLVLEGEQGSKKSTSLSMLGEMENNYNWHVETSMSTENKDFFMQMQGKAIIEFSEGETLSRTEVKRMKSIITTQIDKFRPPYERVSQDFPRRCVFAMTTNESEYLKDDTGNRRWLPVKLKLKQANIEWLRDNRDSLFAEAYHRINYLKETIYQFPEEATKNEQKKRRIRDVNADEIVNWYEGLTQQEKDYGVNIKHIYTHVLNNSAFAKPIDRLEEMKIAGVLRGDLNLEKRLVRVSGKQGIHWFPQDAEVIQEALINLKRDDEVDPYIDFI